MIDVIKLSELYRLLSDPTRLSIVLQLGKGERSVSALSEHLSLSQCTVSHHLRVLLTHNIVSYRRQGKHIIYGLSSYGDTESYAQTLIARLVYCDEGGEPALQAAFAKLQADRALAKLMADRDRGQA